MKKKGRKWTTSSWKSYKAPLVSGYKANTLTVKATKVTYKTKNKVVKITYKAVKTNNSKDQLRRAALNVVNRFRAKNGVKPVKMSSKYSALLDKRATAKAKQYVTTGTYDHSGYHSLPRYLNTYPIVRGKIIYHGGETLHAWYCTTNMKNDLTRTFTENIQAEKDDYIAIKVKHTKKRVTNISGTIGHYTMMVDPGNHIIYVGVGHYGRGNNAIGCIVIEYHA